MKINRMQHENTRQQGTLEQWNDDKGFGFASAANGAPRVFVHIKAFENRSRRPAVGDRISYNMERDAQGRWKAARVLMMEQDAVPSTSARPASTSPNHGNHQSPKGKRQGLGWPLGLAIAAFAAVLLLAGLNVLPHILGLWVPLISLITYGVYAMDKSAAQQGAWRTKENTLHVLSILGGWPGALIAQRTLRHKSSKQSFQAVFWITVIINVVLIGWLTQDGGQQWLHTLLPVLLRNL